MVNRKTVLIIVAIGLAFVAGFGLAARMTSPGGDVIDRSVVATGGGESADGSGRQLSGTIGQPIAGMSTASNGTILVGGFQTMRAPGGPTAARRWQHY